MAHPDGFWTWLCELQDGPGCELASMARSVREEHGEAGQWRDVAAARAWDTARAEYMRLKRRYLLAHRSGPVRHPRTA